MVPAVGRIVHYKLAEHDVARINEARRASFEAGGSGRVGNPIRSGEVYPLLICRVWEHDGVNGQVFLDGNDSLWVTSAAEGDAEGCWHEPERV